MLSSECSVGDVFLIVLILSSSVIGFFLTGLDSVDDRRSTISPGAAETIRMVLCKRRV